jgi:hypothetical protein
MFEIIGDDIAALNDRDLRTLIGLLCEAEMRRRGLPTSAVTWGGNQDAKDGGLDVRVALPNGTSIAGFIPNPQSGFQVKKPDMPRTEILNEMRPKPACVLRPVLIELADASGAYIIISSTGSTSDPALTNRRNAMAEAVKGTAAEGKLALDFYDRNRVATWVRDHKGLIPWLRSQIGKAIPGWQSYGSWSHAPQGVDASYLTDDQARIRTGDKDEGDGISAIEGINRIRKLLTNAGHVVRLIGLSGVGKTRFAEALFDSSLGECALDPSLAIYTNIADEPNPSPKGLASDLNAGQTRAILVIDNCPPELHRQLSDVARAKGSTISVITIEYDIQEDEPEGTDVFALDTSSPEIVEKLVARRYPDLSPIDAHTIADFSGGNARVALALASRIEKTETIAGLSDEDLFKRLFQQRKDPDPSLLSIAQACSLVYSFEGEMLVGDRAELPVLGTLIGKTADDVYAGVAELRRRDLIQARGEWRAVLPHAIANRLAKMALQNIPPAKIQAVLVDGGSERILRSFSRRLGYLDDSKEAKLIAQAWLAPNGLLGDVTSLSELGRAMLTNIAPIMPEAALSSLESALSGADTALLQESTHLVRLLRSLAYEPHLFESALALLVRIAAATPGDALRESEATSVVKSLFHIVLSGTHAPVEMRVKAAEKLLQSENANVRAIGVKALEALMKTGNFSAHHEFAFGARSRDWGYHPRTSQEVSAWFDAALTLARNFALSEGPETHNVQKALARRLRGLWKSGLVEELDRLAREIAMKSFWRDGWIATRQTLIYDKSLDSEARERLTALEAFLRPKDLVSKVQGFVVAARGGSLDLDVFADEDSNEKEEASGDNSLRAREERWANKVRQLARDVAADETALRILLPELVAHDGRVWVFAAALAEAAKQPREMWDVIVAEFASSKQIGAGVILLDGFLGGLQKRDAALAEDILDQSLEDQVLAPWFPDLQARLKIDDRALARLHRALDLGIAPIDRFCALAYGGACDRVPAALFRDLVLAIARRPGGNAVSLEIISMRLHADQSEKRQPLPEVREAGRALLSEFKFHDRNGREAHEGYRLGAVAHACLAGPEGICVVRDICHRLMTAAEDHYISGDDYGDLMEALLLVHPIVVLDELFSGDERPCKRSVDLLRSFRLADKVVTDVVSDETFLAWCDQDPIPRYPLAAAVATLFRRPKDGEPHQWTPLTESLLKKAPDPRLVLNEIVWRLQPSGWSGSLATKLEERLKLLDSLPSDDTMLVTAMVEAKAYLQKRIDTERRREAEESRSRNTRFE